MTPLYTLPPEHPLRNRPLKGSETRTYCKHGEDITIPPERRGEDWVTWKWTPWAPLKPMRIDSKTYNDLGPTWTDNREFRFV